MAEVGARQLRADLAAHLRRVASGESVTVTVDGVPVAVLAPPGPLAPSPLAALVAAGALVPPRRPVPPLVPREPLTTLSTVRPESLFGGVR